MIAGTPDGSRIRSVRDQAGLHLQGDDLAEMGVTIRMLSDDGANLSGGQLKIR